MSLSCEWADHTGSCRDEDAPFERWCGPCYRARVTELEYKLDGVERCVTYGLATYSVDVGGIIKALSPRRLLPDHYHVVSGILDSKET